MSTKRLTIYLGLFLLLGFSATLALAAPRAIELLQNQPEVSLLTTDEEFNPDRTVTLDFSSYSCCVLLIGNYPSTIGVRFTQSFQYGWGTYQDSGFVTHVTIDPTNPGAPAGISGTRITLAQPTKKIGMYVQSGYPFSFEQERPNKSITIKAYDADGNLIFAHTTDTCLDQAALCVPKFIGVKSNAPIIESIEISINETYIWSLDDLKVETTSTAPDPYPYPLEYPYYCPNPFPCPNPYPFPNPYPYPFPYP